nr:hypothetical protein [Mycobacterium shigaense]
MAAIADAFCPNVFDATSDASAVRLIAIAAGGTVIANAVSKAEAAAVACSAVCSACIAVIFIHTTYGAAASAMASDAAPRQLWLVRTETADP